ncbi:MAG: CHAT domain-containing protein [Gammaproteobacteria bacterium]|nr:CHAT domain-containing protein [Gammaproteobacteria bacterium]NIO62420.1 CHAT domain-containing protein [Gammaproteobacteria bacterium]
MFIQRIAGYFSHPLTIGGSLAEIQTSLQDGNYHILHYSGHGAFEGDMGYLVLENEEGLTDLVPADQFARSLEQYHSLQLITLSGCQTAQFSDYENLNGVAQCLIQAGFPMVIGMQRSISDWAATSFAHHFYA